MASTCISNCLTDARTPVRATYVNLYKWPESDVAFVRSLSVKRGSPSPGHPPVVDIISCRQLYLRSYTFSPKNKKSSSRALKIKEKIAAITPKRSKPRGGGGAGGGGGEGGRGGGSYSVGFYTKAKKISYVALESIFRRLRSCTTKVEVIG